MKTSSRILLTLTVLIFSVFISCRKNDEAEIISYRITDNEADVTINGENHYINIDFPENFRNAGSLTAEFMLSEGATAKVDGIIQVSGKTKNDFTAPVLYDVVSEDGDNLITWKVRSSNNSYTYDWGLGGFEENAVSNERNYEWYIDQGNTGIHSGNNCGPASVTMAARWSNQSFSKTTEDARATYRSAGGWWYTADIDNYLTNNSIPHSIVMLSAPSSDIGSILPPRLDEGRIAILCLDMYYIRSEVSNTQRVDKFYSASSIGWGHFIVVKGYKKVDGKIFFEVYDPYSFGSRYNDGSLKGLDRYYRSEDLGRATSLWWNYAFLVTATGKGITDDGGLDPASLPQAWGR